MIVICNSSPIIFLSNVGRLDILHEVFEKVYIPEAVYDEILLSGKEDVAVKKLRKYISDSKIEVFNVKNELAIRALSGRLHSGEVEVIVGAMEIGVNNVVLDDLHARKKAKQFNLKVSGTLGVLRIANSLKLIENLENEINKLISLGFRISPELLKRILNEKD